jgi:Adenylylsulphate kinase
MAADSPGYLTLFLLASFHAGRNLSPVTTGSPPGAEGVLITGVYGSGKSSVAAEIAYLLEERRQPYALLDVDFLGWGGADFSGHSAGRWLTLRNLASVVANYREAGVGLFVLAYFVADHDVLRQVREAAGMPLRVVRLTVPLPDIRQRLAADVTSGRQDDLREAEAQIAASEGVGLEDLVVANDRPVGIVTGEIMSWLGWQ